MRPRINCTDSCSMQLHNPFNMIQNRWVVPYHSNARKCLDLYICCCREKFSCGLAFLPMRLSTKLVIRHVVILYILVSQNWLFLFVQAVGGPTIKCLSKAAPLWRNRVSKVLACMFRARKHTISSLCTSLSTSLQDYHCKHCHRCFLLAMSYITRFTALECRAGDTHLDHGRILCILQYMLRLIFAAVIPAR